MKIFLDTSVLVAALATRGLCADLLRVVLCEHQLVLSEQVLTELEAALIGKLRLPAARAERAVQFFAAYVEPVTIEPAALPQLRDPTDAAIVAAARAMGEDLLVSGDQDILASAVAVDVAVVSPRGAWERLRAGGDPRGEVNEA